MRPGRPQYPRRKLDPKLRALVRDEMRDGKPAWFLSLVAGFTQPCEFSTILHSPRVPATPLTVQRLTRLAEAVGFPADSIFVTEDDKA